MNKLKKKYFKKINIYILLSKFWVLKIAGKTYTSIPALLFRSDQGRDILVEPIMVALLADFLYYLTRVNLILAQFRCHTDEIRIPLSYVKF